LATIQPGATLDQARREIRDNIVTSAVVFYGANDRAARGLFVRRLATGTTRMTPNDADDTEDTTIYQVVMNHEEQYSIWPASRELPLGWQAVGIQGLKPVCLAYIEKVWTDMRPLSLRDRMKDPGE
jgi:MbtH protein